MIRNFVDFLFLYGHFVSAYRGLPNANMLLIGIRREKISTKTRTSTTKTITQSPRRDGECRAWPVAVETQPRGHPCFGLEAQRDARPVPGRELRASRRPCSW